MRATSAALSEKPFSAKLAAIRSRRDDRGMTGMPCSMCQRSTTCAGSTPCSDAMSFSTGSRRLVFFSGLYPSTVTPRSRLAASFPGLCRAGLHGIWLTDGTSPVASTSSSISAAL